MLIRLMRAIELVTGYLLGAICTGLQLGSTLVCVFIVMMVTVVTADWTTR